ncbi:MAG: CRISPR-associated endonuclease Cas2 [Peptococcaceae bacterium]|jgi:CRISPR-associated endonuclease Cas2|nr:CRISPR-associated endonuclease Cas2 [Peptococcaceae bacterium]
MSRTQCKITLVCYDIASDKLRRNIDKCLKDFGVRLQFSLFICRLDAAGAARCREKLLKVLRRYHKEKAPADSIIVFERFHPDIACCLLGAPIEREPSLFEVI